MVFFWIAALLSFPAFATAPNSVHSLSTKIIVERVGPSDLILKAVDQDQASLVEQWIKKGNSPDKNLLDRAALRGSEKVFKVLLSHQEKLKKSSHDVWRDVRGTPLLLVLTSLATPNRESAAKFERMILLFLKNHVDQVNARDLAYIGDGRTALHQAVANGSLNVMKILIASGAEIDSLDSNFETPLHYAARFGQLEALKILIGHGADPNAVSKHTRITPLLAAAENGHTSIIRKLLYSGAKKNLKDAFGKTAPQRYREFVSNYSTKNPKNHN